MYCNERYDTNKYIVVFDLYCLYFVFHKRDWVSLYCSGCTAVSIHGREPTTERHGGFDLLRFRPGPVHPSLDNLVVPGSPRISISIPNLVRTPDRHSPLQLRTPELKRSASLSLPVAWITGARHCTRREAHALLEPLTLRKNMSLLILHSQ